eukprot:1474576-Prymnesium_polylepis.1
MTRTTEPTRRLGNVGECAAPHPHECRPKQRLISSPVHHAALLTTIPMMDELLDKVLVKAKVKPRDHQGADDCRTDFYKYDDDMVETLEMSVTNCKRG